MRQCNCEQARAMQQELVDAKYIANRLLLEYDRDDYMDDFLVVVDRYMDRNIANATATPVCGSEQTS